MKISSRTAFSVAVAGLCAIASSPSALSSDFSVQVVSVLDGDTIEVLHNQRAERIRLNGIDCPEKGQAYGKKAKQAVASLVFGKPVTLRTYGQDKYGRTIADVLLSDGTHVNRELVRGGWCWWYRKYAPLDTELEQLEKSARDKKRGLWVDPAPVPPWVYRKTRRGQSLDMSDAVPLDAAPGDSATSRGPPPTAAQFEASPNAARAATASLPYPIIGNRRSRIYHRPDCPNYSQIAKRNRVEFNSATEAEQAGYRIAGNCP